MRAVVGAALALALLFAVSAALAAPVKLADRTPVRVAITQTLTSGEGKQDDEVGFEVREDLYGPNRELLVAKGTRATGRIVLTKMCAIFQKCGKLEFSCESTTGVDGAKVPLRCVELRDKIGTATFFVAQNMVGRVQGVFIHRMQAVVSKGTELTVWVDGDVTIDPAKGQVTATPGATAATAAMTAAAGTLAGTSGSQAPPVAAASAAPTYTITLKPDVARDIVSQLLTSGHVTADSHATIAAAEFELKPEKEGMRIDRMVARNERDDLNMALGASHGIGTIDAADWDRVAASVNPDSSKLQDLTTIRFIGTSVKATHVIVGSVSDRGTLVVVTARLVNAATGEVVSSASVDFKK